MNSTQSNCSHDSCKLTFSSEQTHKLITQSGFIGKSRKTHLWKYWLFKNGFFSYNHLNLTAKNMKFCTQYAHLIYNIDTENDGNCTTKTSSCHTKMWFCGKTQKIIKLITWYYILNKNVIHRILKVRIIEIGLLYRIAAIWLYFQNCIFCLKNLTNVKLTAWNSVFGKHIMIRILNVKIIGIGLI